MAFKFPILNRWHRFGIALSVLWLIAGTGVYVSSLGLHEPGQMAYDHMPSALGWWAILCAKSGIPIYRLVNIPGSGLDFFTKSSVDLYFDLLGYLAFVLGPMLIGWIVLFLILWASKSKKSPKSNDAT